MTIESTTPLAPEANELKQIVLHDGSDLTNKFSTHQTALQIPQSGERVRSLPYSIIELGSTALRFAVDDRKKEAFLTNLDDQGQPTDYFSHFNFMAGDRCQIGYGTPGLKLPVGSSSHILLSRTARGVIIAHVSGRQKDTTIVRTGWEVIMNPTGCARSR